MIDEELKSKYIEMRGCKSDPVVYEYKKDFCFYLKDVELIELSDVLKILNVHNIVVFTYINTNHLNCFKLMRDGVIKYFFIKKEVYEINKKEEIEGKLSKKQEKKEEPCTVL